MLQAWRAWTSRHAQCTERSRRGCPCHARPVCPTRSLVPPLLAIALRLHLTNFLTQPAGMRIERRGRLRNLQGDFMHMYLRSDVIHVCIACGRSAKSGEEGLRPDLPEGGKSRYMYLKGVEGTILVVPRWAVPDRPPASWYRTHLSAWAAICYFCIRQACRYQSSCYTGLL
jgi:hypothetical protein